MSGSALGPLRYKGRIFKASGGGLTSQQRAQIQRNKAKALQLAQLRAMDRFAGGVYRREGAFVRSMPPIGLTKYCDMGIGASGTAATGVSGAGTILTFYNMSSAFGGPSASLFQIVQGTTKNNRIGNKVFVTHIRAKMNLILSSSTYADQIRWILYKDNQANGAAATVAQILELASTAGIESFQSMDYVDRIKIIKDKWVKLIPTIGVSGTSSTPIIIPQKFNHKANCEVRYSSTTGAITEIQSDNYGILAIAYGGAATTMSGTFRVYFRDH